MKTRSTLVTLARILVLMVLLVSSACTGKPAQQPTVVASAPSPTAAPTNTPLPTDTPLPTATATQTLLPTPTNTPEPTPTPDGFLSDPTYGFSLILPEDWQVIEQNEDGTVIGNETRTIIAHLLSMAETEATPVEELATELQSSGYVLRNTAKFDVAGASVQADHLEMTASQNGQTLDAWFLYAHQGTRSYIIWVMGPANYLDGKREEVSAVLDTLQFFRPMLYELPTNETFTELGSDPIAEDLDPATATSSADNYAGLLFAGLVRLDQNLQVVPDLAESWAISPDGTVYTFTLRQGIQFASGDPITAEDVRKSWERALDPATKSTTARTYLGDIVGAKDKLDGKSDEVTGIKVIDDRTLEVTLDGPKAYFLAKLTYPTAFIIDTVQSEVDPKNWMFEPNASGPYKIKEYKEEEAIIFERSDTYYQPARTRYILYIFMPGGSPLSLFEEGTIDVLPVSAEEQIEISKPDHPLNKLLVTAPSMCTTTLSLNTNLAPTDDPLVRKALALATDRAQWIDKLSNGISTPANGILPPAMPGYNSSRVLPAFDPEAAKAALAESSYAGQPLKIVISASGYADSQNAGVALLTEQWKQNLGAEVTVDFVDPDKFVENVRQDPGNVVVSGWCADYVDPENFLDVLFHTGSEFNYANLSDADLDAILDEARVALDPAKRLELYAQAEEHVLSAFYTIPMTNGRSAMLINARVKGYTLTPIGTRILDQIRLESE